MLRVAFPVNVHSDQATFDIQYGYVQRPTHQNTSWEQARFEVVAHRYADLSNADFGVALLNDSKYGHRVTNGVLDLNLLRSPNYPDPDADQGEHDFVYSLLPHAGDLVHSEVLAEATRLNQGLMIFDGYRNSRRVYPVRLSGDGLSLEVVKKAERESCHVLRIVETLGRHSCGRLEVDLPHASLEETDLMEWASQEPTQVTGPVDIQMRPFEIRTYKLRFKGE